MNIAHTESSTYTPPPGPFAEAFKVPLNRAAAMSHIRFMVGQGYTYFNAGSVAIEKAIGFGEKMARKYPITATPNQRAMNKKKGIANVTLIVYRDDADKDSLRWFLLATPGARELDASGKPSKDGPFRDLIFKNEAMKSALSCPIHWGQHYRLVRKLRIPPAEINKHQKRGGKLSWTWEMVPATYKAWEARIEAAAARGYAELRSELSAVLTSPMFGGVRDQVLELGRIAAAAWKKNHKSPYVSALKHPLPYFTHIEVFRELTLYVLVVAMCREKNERMAAAEAQAKSVIQGVDAPRHLSSTLKLKG